MATSTATWVICVSLHTVLLALVCLALYGGEATPRTTAGAPASIALTGSPRFAGASSVLTLTATLPADVAPVFTATLTGKQAGSRSVLSGVPASFMWRRVEEPAATPASTVVMRAEASGLRFSPGLTADRPIMWHATLQLGTLPATADFLVQFPAPPPS